MSPRSLLAPLRSSRKHDSSVPRGVAPPARAAPSGEPPQTLEELARAGAGGDTAAIGALLKALAPEMIRAAQALMGLTHPDLDDVVQHAFIGLVQALPAFRHDCSPRHYALRIVARTSVATRRRAALRAGRFDGSVDLDAVPAARASAELPAGEGAIAAECRRAAVRRLLETLPEEQAETLALRVALGFSLAEVAESTGVPVNTVRSRVRLAKEALRRRVAAEPEPCAALELDAVEGPDALPLADGVALATGEGEP